MVNKVIFECTWKRFLNEKVYHHKQSKISNPNVTLFDMQFGDRAVCICL